MGAPPHGARERGVALPGGLAGTLTLPKGAGPQPVVVLLHGFGGHRDEIGGLFAKLAARLSERGIASLRFDFPGCGASKGDFADTTIDLFAGAAAEALRFAAEGRSADGPPLGLLGYSFGAAVATTCLAGAVKVSTLVLWAPIMDPATDMIRTLGAERAAEAERNGSVALPWGTREIRLKREFFRSLSAVAPLENIADYTGDIFTIAGGADHLAKYVDAIRESAKRARRCEGLQIEGADHFFDVLKPGSRFPDLVTTVTADFFASSFKAH